MFNFEKLVVGACLVLALFSMVLSQNDDEQTEEDKKARCQYLNTVMSDSDNLTLTSCCVYPEFVINVDQFMECFKECIDGIIAGTAGSCCINICCYVDKMGIFKVAEDENGKIVDVKMELEPLIAAFLNSVGNDTAWVPVITNSVNRCYNDLWSTDGGYSCDFIPNTYFDIVLCAYVENYLKCPAWNPSGFEGCKYVHEYVEKCE